MKKRKNYTKPDTWKISRIIDAINEEVPAKKEKIIIPKYQRSLVWNKNQKKSFIESLKSDFPVGSLLLYHLGPQENVNRYSLTDGLQRTNTIIEYDNAPTQFFDEANLEDSFINKILSFVSLEINITNQSKLKKIITDWISELKGFSESIGFSSSKLAYEIESKLAIDLAKNDLRNLEDILVPFNERIESDSNIKDVEIPVVIYTGPPENLPTIFERINSKGTQLNKYEVYAATWSHEKYKIEIENRELIDLIKAKYDALIEQGFEVLNYNGVEEEFYTSQFSIFEYIFGLGKLLSKKYPQIFGEYDSESAEPDSIAFNLLTVCLGLELKDMDKLPDKMLMALKNGQTIFEDALLNSIAFVYSTLKPFIGLRANVKKRTDSNRNIIYHSEYQVVSLVSAVFKRKYNDNIEEKTDWNINEAKLRKNIPLLYLHDIIKQVWRRGVKDFDNRRYDEELTKEKWDIIFNEWMESQLKRSESERVRLRQEDILFLKYIYAHKLTSYQENSTDEFEIEHIVPVAKLKDAIKQHVTTLEGLPISCVANLCLIQKEINRDKGDETIYQYFDNLIQKKELTQTQANVELAKIENFTFTKKNELKFVKSITKDKYTSFLTSRFAKLKQQFYEHNKIV